MAGVEEDFVTVTEAAAELGLTEAAVRARLTKGQMSGRKLGPIWVVTRAEVERWRQRGRMRSPRGVRKPRK
jgi:hypothetical protein